MSGDKFLASAKGKGGRPAFKPTDDQRYSVPLMKIAGMTEEMISRCLGISEQTLRKYFRDELDLGEAKIHVEIADTIVRNAKAGNAALLQFFAQTRMGWKKTEVNEHTGKDGGPIEVSARDRISSRIAGIAARKREGGNPPDADGG